MTHKIRLGEIQVSVTIASRRLRYRKDKFRRVRFDRLTALTLACGVATVGGNLALLVVS